VGANAEGIPDALPAATERQGGQKVSAWGAMAWANRGSPSRACREKTASAAANALAGIPIIRLAFLR
jgi:hypothetical protein